MVDKVDSYVAVGFTGALVLAVGGAGIASLFQPAVNAVVEKSVAELLSAEIEKSGGTFEDLRYDRAADTVTIKGLTFLSTGADGGTLHIASGSLKGTNPALFVGGADGAAAGPVPVFDAVSLSGVSFTSADAQAEMSAAQIDLGPALLFAPDAPMPARADGEDGDPADPEMLQIVSVLHRLKLDSLQVQGLEINDTGEDPVSLEAGSLSLTGYDRGDTGPIAARAVAMQFEGSSASMAAADLASVSARPNLAGLYVDMLDGRVDETSHFATVRSGDFSVAGVGVVSQFGDLSLDKFSVSDLVYEGMLAVHSVTSAEGLSFSAGLLGPEIGPLLSGLGYETVTLGLKATQSIDLEQNLYRLEDFEIAGADMGAVSIAATFGNIGYLKPFAAPAEPGQPAPDPMAMIEGMMSTSLVEAAVIITDNSLTDRLLSKWAEDEGMTREDLIASLAAQQAAVFGAPVAQPAAETEAQPLGDVPVADDVQMAEDVPAPEAASGFAAQWQAAVAAFLENPGQLTLRAAPPEPVPLAVLPMTAEAPDTIAEALGLSVEVSPPAEAP